MLNPIAVKLLSKSGMKMRIGLIYGKIGLKKISNIHCENNVNL